MEPPAQIPCSGRCLIHIHSEAGRAWLMRRSCPFPQRLGPDCITHYLVRLGNNEPTFVSAVGIHTFNLRNMLDNFERQGGERIQNIFTVIPASHNPYQYQSLLCAVAAAAGVNIVQIIERSHVAALAYKCIHPPLRRTVVVFELGGQILEISVFIENGDLNKTAAVFDLGCPLFNHMITVLPTTFGDIDFTLDADFLCHIRTECELSKDALCLGLGTVEIKIQRHGKETRTLIDRELLVQMNLDHLRSAIIRCLMEARVGQVAVDKVVLAGASSTMPEVRSVLLEFFQRQSIKDYFDPADLFRIAIDEFLNSISSKNHISVTGFQTHNWGLYSL